MLLNRKVVMRFFLVVILLTGCAFSQSALTKEDRAMSLHIKEVWAKANKNNYEKLFADLIDECEKYLKVHPTTVIKPGILGYVFEMTSAISQDVSVVTKAADDLLQNDSSFKVHLRVAQVLIEKKINDKKGIEILKNVLPETPGKKEFYDINLLLAAAELHLKNYQDAISYLNAAIKSDSSRVDGYKGLLDVMNLTATKDKIVNIEKKIKSLEKDPNINVDLSSLSLYDINGGVVSFKNYKGSIITIVFFRFECPYCKKEIPALKELIQKYPGIKFIFVNLGESVPDIKNKYLKESGFTFLQDQSIIKFADVFDKILDITITPQVLVVDKNSIVKFDYRGYQNDFAEKFEQDLTTLK